MKASKTKITDLCRARMRGMSKTVDNELVEAGAIIENPSVSYRIVKTSEGASNE